MSAGTTAAALRRPLHLEPVLVPKPWGGRRLERFGHLLPPDQLIGESWEVSDLDPASTASTPDPATRVAAGPLRGRTLQELIASDREALLGRSPDADGRFPLLVKLLDAREHLSVQVHPPAAYVAEHPDVHLKTESWVVVDAEPGADLLIGLAPGVTRDDLRAALGTPGMVPLLRRVPARAGEVHHLPAGIIHALGAGVLVAEVQTPSDTTFRLYDWTEEHGRAPRALHLHEGLRALELAWEHNVDPPAPCRDGGLLISTEEYTLRRHRLDPGARVLLDGGTARVLQVVDGEVDVDGAEAPLRPGGVLLLPAAWSGAMHGVPRAVVLEMAAGASTATAG